MPIASDSQDRARLFLQIARECPGFEEQATYVAQEWLIVAAIAALVPPRRAKPADSTG